MATNTVINGIDIYVALLPFVLPAVGAIIAALLGWLLSLVQMKFGVDVDNSHRDALQTALTNAAGLMVQRMGTRAAAAIHLDVHNAHVASSINYVIKGAPEAVAKWGLSPEIIAKMLEAKLGLLTGITDANGEQVGGARPSIPVTSPPGASA